MKLLEALDCLAKRPGESYEDSINRILTNPTACKVKYADLRDNSDLSRIPNPTHEDRERAEKYKRAMEQIAIALKKH